MDSAAGVCVDVTAGTAGCDVVSSSVKWAGAGAAGTEDVLRLLPTV